MTRPIFLIYARAANGAIGRAGRLPWHLPADLAHFKSLTMGCPMIMGRKTFESLPGMLPGRRHIVLTRRERWDSEGAQVVRSVEEALAAAHESAGEDTGEDNGENESEGKSGGENESGIAVIGGAAIFDSFMAHAAYAEVTQIHAEFAGDVFMPELGAGWEVAAREDHPAHGERPAYSFVTYRKLPEDEA